MEEAHRRARSRRRARLGPEASVAAATGQSGTPDQRSLARRLLGRLMRSAVQARKLLDDVRLLRRGAAGLLPPRPVLAAGGQEAAGQHRGANRVAYFVYNALPYHGAGYAIRTQGLAAGLRAAGIDVTVVARAGYPSVFPAFRSVAVADRQDVDGVPYRFLPLPPSRAWKLPPSGYIRRNIELLTDACAAEPPALIHAASNFVTGLSAIGAARRLGVPCLYEVRGLWEVTRASLDPDYGRSLHFRQSVLLETQACQEADHVIAITGALRDELVRRGVAADRITVLPNGVDAARFQPQPRDALLAAELGLAPDEPVIGYVGSIVGYEGLDDLLRAAAVLRDGGASAPRLLIVGDGAALPECRRLTAELDLERSTIFAGRVPHGEVGRYYSLIDIAPFPRKPLPVCELVSPLKPLEAMALGKCVVASSVAALAEMVAPGRTGLVFEKGRIEALAASLSQALADPALRRRLGAAARTFVQAERDWPILARRLRPIYERLGLSSGGCGVTPPAPREHETRP